MRFQLSKHGVYNRKAHKVYDAGFTLIEIIVVVLIIGILAAIAAPSYVVSLRVSRRADAMSALTQAAARQESWYLTYNHYNSNIGDLMDGSDATSWKTADGYYIVTVTTEVAQCGGAIGSCFILTASAVGPQQGDSDCSAFTLNSKGTQAGCWMN